ncbi:hypothetical protein BOTBODRAFT_550048 [Botryobasidium botryosum FD-172 SS1]|uniref:Uncharacterized protein n=1 Tax=Botryobasidium botryosum (strain FD-172 SS1) TaxID=930990 RepID=A0A067N1S1_BOTB1|nr:hypothetical protein BOTBODRAFT_550048 [Botryobasidium botryosum FD-172 SS1]
MMRFKVATMKARRVQVWTRGRVEGLRRRQHNSFFFLLHYFLFTTISPRPGLVRLDISQRPFHEHLFLFRYPGLFVFPSIFLEVVALSPNCCPCLCH